MDRNREPRRGTLSRRRHRTAPTLKDSTDVDGGVELQESIRLRERLKKERDLRERASRSSLKGGRRAERFLMHNNNNIVYNDRSEDVGLVDDSSEESVNDDEDEEYEEEHHNNTHHLLHHRKTFHTSGNNTKSFRAAPVWKSGHEIIGVSVPRKARSAATKRSHDWMTNSGGGGGGGEPIQQPISIGPMPSIVAPMSPSSSNVSIRRKLKLSNGSKERPSRGSSVAKSTASNPEEIEIEIAEVLFGLMSQPQGPSSKKEISSNYLQESDKRLNNDLKSRTSSPISGSNIGQPLPDLPQNSTSSAVPFSVVEPKRKRPRQVPYSLENCSARCSSILSTKVEMDQTMKTEVSTSNSSPSLTPGSAAVSYDLGSLANLQLPETVKKDSERTLLVDEVADKKISSVEKDSSVARQEERIREEASVPSVSGALTDTLVGSVNKALEEVERYREDKFQINLMVHPQSRMSPEKGREVDSAVDDKKLNLFSVVVTNTVASMEKEPERSGKGETLGVGGDSEDAKCDTEHVESKKVVENKSQNIDLRLDLERPGEPILAGNKLQQQETITKATAKEEPPEVKPGLYISSSVPVSMPSWPGGLSPMGYMAPLQGVVSMDMGAVPPAPIQMPMFSQPRQKRCATHFYIARNIHHLQQFMKMSPLSLFGSKSGNIGVVPFEDLHANMPARVVNHAQVNKGQALAVPLGHDGKGKGYHLNPSDSAQGNQQILLQQAVPPVVPSNILGPAFIFPLNQQQAVAAAAAAVRPGSAAKSPAITPGASSNATNSSAGSSATGTVPAMSFSYPNMPGNETQYLAILQNNGYPFPIPTVGANSNYRGPHPQPFPLFNGFSYSSQMIHPSQLQQQAVPTSQSQQVQQSHPSALLSSSSSNLHNPQQMSQGNFVNGVSGNGNLKQLAVKNHSSQHCQSSTNQYPQVPIFRQLDNQMGGGDGPHTADNRGTCATMNMYGQNFAMPMHIPNFGLITPPATLGAASSASSSQGDEKHHQSQQSGTKTRIESLPPQTFAMSFGPISGATNPGFDLSMTQNHSIFQNFTDASRHNFQMMAAITAGQTAQHKKDGRASEDDKTIGGDPSNRADDQRNGFARKVPTTAGQSIAFSISELPDRSSIQGSHVFESSSRSLNPESASGRGSHPSMPNLKVSSDVQDAQLQDQLQHQKHLMQFHKQQQQSTALCKTPITSNAIVYPDHLASSGSIAAAMFPNAGSLPQNAVQNNNSNSPSPSPQWKNPPRTSTSQNPSSFSSLNSATLKNVPHQPPRALQNLTQISFGSNQKAAAASHKQPPASNQASSPPMVVGSPTNSSISKGASGSPRITTTSATSNKIGPAPSIPTQQRKSSSSGTNQKSSPSPGNGRNVPSILGNPQCASSPASGSKSQMQQHAHQQQQLAKNLQQAQLFFSNPYMQNQSQHATSTNAPTSGNTGYYLQRRLPDQLQYSPQQPPGSSASTSTGMLSLSGVSTMDPAKAIVAATAAAGSNMKGGGLPSQSILNASQFTAQSPGNHLISGGFSYGHAVPATIQMKPAEEKQPAGNDSLHNKK